MDKDELIQTTERLNEEIFDFINDVEDLFEKYEIKNENKSLDILESARDELFEIQRLIRVVIQVEKTLTGNK